MEATGHLEHGRMHRIAVAIALDSTLVAGELAAGIIAHSTGLIADAGHNLADGAGLVLAYVAVRFSRRSPTTTRSFGYLRATILAALANLGILLVVSALVAAQAISRIVHPGTVAGGVVALTAGIGFLINLSIAVLLLRGDRDLNMRAVVLHFGGDAVASVGVVIAGLVVFTTGRYAIVDPIVALCIAGLIAYVGLGIGRESLEVILEFSPADLDLDVLRATITDVPDVLEVHDLHCWSLSSTVRALSAHVVLVGDPSLEQGRAIADEIKVNLASDFGIGHATLELESERCVDLESEPCSIETAHEVDGSDHHRHPGTRSTSSRR